MQGAQATNMQFARVVRVIEMIQVDIIVSAKLEQEGHRLQVWSSMVFTFFDQLSWSQRFYSFKQYRMLTLAHAIALLLSHS